MISIEDLKTYLNISNSELGFDIFLEKCIDYTFNEIENYCRQPITATTQEKYFEVYGNSIEFYNFPIQSISKVDIYSLDYNHIIELTNTEFTLIQPSSLFACILNSNDYHNHIAKIAYSCGYSTIPLDIQKVHLEMAALMFKESDERGGLKGGRLGLTSNSENVNQVSSNISYSSPTEKWYNILNKYRSPIV